MPFELKVTDVSHRYGSLDVLSGISVTIPEGEILAVVGPSGCGKSTLLGIAGGLITPTAGTVAIAGDMPSSLNPFTYVFQDFALLPWRSVADNVRLGLEHHPMTRAERDDRVARALALTGLAEFATALPKQLSGGMRQRTGIARALAVDPAVLLLDEPLSALDAQTRELLLEDFERIWNERGTTAIYVTHNLGEALRLADRILVLARRPGRTRELVTVPIPRTERTTPAAAARLAALQDTVWDLLRTEARDADRELNISQTPGRP